MLFCILTPATLKLKLVPPPAVKVTLVPAQKMLSASELVNVGVGIGLTVFVIFDEVAEHPFALLTITFIIWPFVNKLVVYVAEALFCTLIPPILKS